MPVAAKADTRSLDAAALLLRLSSRLRTAGLSCSAPVARVVEVSWWREAPRDREVLPHPSRWGQRQSQGLCDSHAPHEPMAVRPWLARPCSSVAATTEAEHQVSLGCLYCTRGLNCTRTESTGLVKSTGQGDRAG